MAAAVEQMVYFGEVPWHGLGKKVDEAMTSAEALKEAGLDWEVEMRDIFTLDQDKEYKQIITSQSVVRLTDDSVLGVVGSRWRPLQNKDAFKFMDDIVGEKLAMFHTAGSLNGGRRVWMLAQLPGNITVKGKDTIGKFLLLANGFDGSLAVTIQMTPIRVVCANTLSAAIEGRTQTRWKLSHTESVANKVEDVREQLGLINHQFDQAGLIFNALADIQWKEDQVKDYLLKLIPDNPEAKTTTRTENTRAHILSLYDRGGIGLNDPETKHTAWAAYNAVVEYYDWHRGQSNDTRMKSAWFGETYGKRQDALSTAIEMSDLKSVA